MPSGSAREILFFDIRGLDFVKQLFVAPAFASSNVNQIINMSTFLNFRLSSCVFVPVLFTDGPALGLPFQCVVLGRENSVFAKPQNKLTIAISSNQILFLMLSASY